MNPEIHHPSFDHPLCARSAAPEGLVTRAEMVRPLLNDNGSCANHLLLAGRTIQRLSAALELALVRLCPSEPGDSRAVSDEFVAMAAVLTGRADEDCVKIIRDALVTQNLDVLKRAATPEGRARLRWNPYTLVLEVFNDLYPGHDVEVGFAPEAKCDGGFAFTVFPDDGSKPEVWIGVHTPVEASIEVIAHELAHVAVGIDAEHGPAWEAAFEAIHAEYAKRMGAPA